MKILYVSRLEGNLWQGPTHSVPMQIKYQSLIDDVLWVNLCPALNAEWKELPYYKEMSKGLKTGLDDIPNEYSNPDIVVFEGVYEYPFAKIIKDILAQNIPYVIVPRSALTSDAQKKKHIKKHIGNTLFFRKFIYNARSIQYLTQAEYVDSKNWSTAHFVAPNGIYPKQTWKQTFFDNGQVNITYVGRIEKYQKGLDILISACSIVADELRDSRTSLHLYGPDRENSFFELKNDIEINNLSDVIILHESVFGKEKETVLLNSDAFIMTSRFEGLPMGMIEALSYGIPVIATHGTNLTDEIRMADAGWTSDNSVEGIVNMLRKVLAEKDKFSEKSNNALNLSKQYNWSTIAKCTHDEYERLTNM